MCIARLVPDEVTRIAAYLDATTSLPERADLLFVFGNRLPTPAQMAVDLFTRYPTSLIVLTGGSNQHTGENEALSHYTIVRSAGVPEEAIIVESRSRNTLENVTLAVPLLEQTIPLTSVTAVLAICKWMHSRRALMTSNGTSRAAFAITRRPMNRTLALGRSGGRRTPLVTMSTGTGTPFPATSPGAILRRLAGLATGTCEVLPASRVRGQTRLGRPDE